MIEEFKEIYSNPNRVMVDWNMLIRCNYDCSYCFPGCHDTVSAIPDVSTLIPAAERLISNIRVAAPNKEIYIFASGGEPFLIKGIDRLFKRIHQMGCKISVQTNLSAPVSVYLESMPYVTTLNPSWHFEQQKNKHFKKVVKAIANKCNLFVRIMDHPEYPHDVADAVEFCKTNKVHHSLRVIRTTENIPLKVSYD